MTNNVRLSKKLHVNDTVKPKISELSHTPTTYFTSHIFKIKSILKQFTK